MSKQTGRAWVFGDDVDTDLIYHNKYLAETDPKQMPQYAFEYYPGMEVFAKAVRPGDFVVAGRNFGCGSSREHAVYCLQFAGVPCVLAETCSRIYYRNAINNGLLLIEGHTDRIDVGDELFVDVTGRVIKKVNDPVFAMPFTLSEKEVKIINEGGLLNYIEKYNSLDI